MQEKLYHSCYVSHLKALAFIVLNLSIFSSHYFPFYTYINGFFITCVLYSKHVKLYVNRHGSAVGLTSKPEAIWIFALAVQDAFSLISLKLRITILFVPSLNLIFRAVPSLLPQVELGGQNFSLPPPFFDRLFCWKQTVKFLRGSLFLSHLITDI